MSPKTKQMIKDQQEQAIIKEFEELGYEIKFKSDNVLKFIIKDEDTVLTIYKTSKDYRKVYYGETKIIPEVITLQEHQLLHRLFKIWNWI